MASVDNLPVRAAGNVLDYLDESFYLDFRAQGHPSMIQFVWIYDHELDLAALRRFHTNLGHGLLSRCVEHSPLPFARSRWVRWTPPAEVPIAPVPRPREEIPEWVDEQAALTIDIEHGPPWRLAVLPLTGGGAAVSLLVAHAIADGMGMMIAVRDAVNGVANDLGYPEPKSRKGFRALTQDLRQLLRDLPRVASAVVLAPLGAKAFPMRRRAGIDTSLARKALDSASTDRRRLPAVSVLVDVDQWDARAAALGGSSNPLLIAFTARLCGILGWLAEDGRADLAIPVNERTADDTRGNALTTTVITVDPARATDLVAIRAEVKAALTRLKEMRNRIMAPLALIPFIPRGLANRFQVVLQRSAALTCSHFGDLDPAVNRPDGTDAEWFFAKHSRTPDMADPGLLRRAGGMFFPIASGRLGGHIYISVCYSNAEGTTTNAQLRAAVEQALEDVGVTGRLI